MDAKPWYAIAKNELFSRSLIWQLQRRYFEETGFDAWRLGEVPHYITSNPVIANSYAEIIFTFYREQLAISPDSQNKLLYILELGAGPGRFAYHFLARLQWLCDETGIALNNFRYILTDFTQSNLDFWSSHPYFSPYFENGILDIALLDITSPGTIELQVSGKILTHGSLHLPLVTIANYVFDSVPQELFYIDNNQAYQCLVSILVNNDGDEVTAAEILAAMQCRYNYQAMDGDIYREAWLQQILNFYTNQFNDTHLLFPADGLKCLHWLKSISHSGLMLLTADKGNHRLEALANTPLPDLVRHGSLSLTVNYHALKYYCEHHGGTSLFTTHHYHGLNIACLLMVPDAHLLKETKLTYKHFIEDFGPDDFYTISKHARKYIGEMGINEILAYLRLSMYDSHQFSRYLPRIMELAADIDTNSRSEIKVIIDKIWEQYFPIGEELDLANALATYFYSVDDFEQALYYFERSVTVYGHDTGTLCNMAACLLMLGDSPRSKYLLEQVLEHDPDNEAAKEMLKEI